MADKVPEPTFDFHELNDLALDKEWKRHCDEVEKYARKQAKAKRTHSLAKANIEVVEAEVGLEIRSSAKEKLTEAGVKAKVALDPRVRQAVKAEIDARFAVDMIDGAMRTLDHRKKSISDRITLWLADYFKEPAIKSGGKAKMEETVKGEVRRRAQNRDD